MWCEFGVYHWSGLITSPRLFDYDWLFNYLNAFIDVVLIEYGDVTEGYYWGRKQFLLKRVGIASTEAPTSNKPKRRGVVERIIANIEEDMKQKILNDQLSAKVVAEHYGISFPTAQKLMQRIKDEFHS